MQNKLHIEKQSTWISHVWDYSDSPKYAECTRLSYRSILQNLQRCEQCIFNSTILEGFPRVLYKGLTKKLYVNSYLLNLILELFQISRSQG